MNKGTSINLITSLKSKSIALLLVLALLTVNPPSAYAISREACLNACGVLVATLVVEAYVAFGIGLARCSAFVVPIFFAICVATVTLTLGLALQAATDAGNRCRALCPPE